MKQLYFALEASTSRWGFGLVIVLITLVGGTIGYTVGQIESISGQGILDFEFGHSTERIHEVLSAYGSNGMALYQRVQLLDLLNPLIYSWFTAMLIDLLLRGTKWRWLVIFALMPGMFDYAENYYLYQFVINYPAVDAGQVAVADVLSLVKQGALMLTVAIFMFAGVQNFLLKEQKEPIGDEQ